MATVEKKAKKPSGSGGKLDVGGALGQKWHGAPAWVWFGAGGGALYWYRKRHAGSSSAAAGTGANTVSTPSPQYGYGNGGGGGDSTSPGGSAGDVLSQIQQELAQLLLQTSKTPPPATSTGKPHISPTIREHPPATPVIPPEVGPSPRVGPVATVNERNTGLSDVSGSAAIIGTGKGGDQIKTTSAQVANATKPMPGNPIVL